jgi:hypothetical protein
MPIKEFLSSPRDRKKTRDNTKGILGSKHARISEAKRHNININRQLNNKTPELEFNKNKKKK